MRARSAGPERLGIGTGLQQRRAGELLGDRADAEQRARRERDASLRIREAPGVAYAHLALVQHGDGPAGSGIRGRQAPQEGVETGGQVGAHAARCSLVTRPSIVDGRLASQRASRDAFARAHAMEPAPPMGPRGGGVGSARLGDAADTERTATMRAPRRSAYSECRSVPIHAAAASDVGAGGCYAWRDGSPHPVLAALAPPSPACGRGEGRAALPSPVCGRGRRAQRAG